MAGLRAIKIAAAVMGALIVTGTLVLVVMIARRAGTPAAVPVTPEAVLDEPAGSHIAGVTLVGDRLVVQLAGGGNDRLVFLDARTGAVVGRVALAR